MRSVSITLLTKDGFAKVIDVSEERFKYGIVRIAKMAGGVEDRREFVQDFSHLTLFRER